MLSQSRLIVAPEPVLCTSASTPPTAVPVRPVGRRTPMINQFAAMMERIASVPSTPRRRKQRQRNLKTSKTCDSPPILINCADSNDEGDDDDDESSSEAESVDSRTPSADGQTTVADGQITITDITSVDLAAVPQDSNKLTASQNAELHQLNEFLRKQRGTNLQSSNKTPPEASQSSHHVQIIPPKPVNVVGAGIHAYTPVQQNYEITPPHQADFYPNLMQMQHNLIANAMPVHPNVNPDALHQTQNFLPNVIPLQHNFLTNVMPGQHNFLPNMVSHQTNYSPNIVSAQQNFLQSNLMCQYSNFLPNFMQPQYGFENSPQQQQLQLQADFTRGSPSRTAGLQTHPVYTYYDARLTAEVPAPVTPVHQPTGGNCAEPYLFTGEVAAYEDICTPHCDVAEEENQDGSLRNYLANSNVDQNSVSLRDVASIRLYAFFYSLVFDSHNIPLFMLPKFRFF